MSIKHKIIIATPHNTTKLFKKTVIYIHTDDETGVAGVMLNVPMDRDVARSWCNALDWQYPERVNHGGPIQQHFGYIIHSSEYAQDTSTQLHDSLAYTGGKKIIYDINRGIGPVDFVLLSGYCFWQPHQLETEIENNLWMVLDFDKDFFFQIGDKETGWKNAISLAAKKRAAHILDTIDIV